jgi:CHAD domain-containing protein
MTRSATTQGTAASLVGPYFTAQVTALLAADQAIGEGDESVVHGGRVATRRVRTVMRVFGPLFNAAAAEHLDHELRWWSGVLGPVRDLQVMQDRLDALVVDLDADLVVGPVRTRIDVELGQYRLEHWAAAIDALTSDRHRALVDDLARWCTEPPWTAEATRTASTLVPMVRKADDSVSTRLAHAHRSGRVEDMHRARKAAKRARYAAEVVAAVQPKGARASAQGFRRLQELLGEHQDSIVSAQLLRLLADKADRAPGESSFTFGLLHEREQERARAIEVEAHRLAHRLFG